jgi:protein TonB
MRHFQLALLCFICVSNSYSQTTTNRYGRIDVEITKEKHPKKVYAKVEIKSAFIGGDSSWLQSFEKSLNQSLTIDRRAKKGKYIVSAVFVVLEDSSLADIRCLNDPGFGMGTEVIRVLKKGMVRWKPGKPGDRPVSPYRRSAITYQDSHLFR